MITYLWKLTAQIFVYRHNLRIHYRTTTYFAFHYASHNTINMLTIWVIDCCARKICYKFELYSYSKQNCDALLILIILQWLYLCFFAHFSSYYHKYRILGRWYAKRDDRYGKSNNSSLGILEILCSHKIVVCPGMANTYC